MVCADVSAVVSPEHRCSNRHPFSGVPSQLSRLVLPHETTRGWGDCPAFNYYSLVTFTPRDINIVIQPMSASLFLACWKITTSEEVQPTISNLKYLATRLIWYRFQGDESQWKAFWKPRCRGPAVYWAVIAFSLEIPRQLADMTTGPGDILWIDCLGWTHFFWQHVTGRAQKEGWTFKILFLVCACLIKRHFVHKVQLRSELWPTI